MYRYISEFDLDITDIIGESDEEEESTAEERHDNEEDDDEDEDRDKGEDEGEDMNSVPLDAYILSATS
ncbi:uncharacterized protein N7496_008246 [Penicillium cataractarum]|uniref:Uncharacterized protein n=1 Tax=Penicillium cataractarum TaxID=2100454 RepID=A0A9W9V6W1_9EURO|nr:uncharacterized protein N7496_008246 [Penicillium cataractarum]KAJ5368486.1 hypothetical protein N7496_008246 [Penicillium cataractarum]